MTAPPIFIHGILPRSGTNFLWDLLLLHPACVAPREPIREDLFLDHSDHLLAFAAAARRAWDPRWGSFAADLPDQLCAGVGEGLLSFLWTDRTRRLVTKSPSVRNLDRFFTFYPTAKLVILVRDGRSVVQSGIDTFGWDFERGCRTWAEAAATIQRFAILEAGRTSAWRLVRYEDLLDDPEGQLRRLFEFLDLDPDSYDFAAARNLPVRGSSAFGREGRDVHWDLVPKDASFAPKERWRSWTPAQLERFEWLAGPQSCHFGYAAVKASAVRVNPAKHTWLDWRWTTTRAIKTAIYHARVRVGTATLPLRRRLGLRRDA
jgi:protein-tyrosine sulfotransferase